MHPIRVKKVKLSLSTQLRYRVSTVTDTLIPLGLVRTSGFFAAAVKQPQRPIISWLCARTAKETHVLLTTWCSQCVRYTSIRHLLCHSMFYDHILAEIWMLLDVYITTDYLGQEEYCYVHLA